MRTAILFAGFAIADAIRTDWYPTDTHVRQFIGVIGVCFIVMDLWEFFVKVSKKS